MRVVLGSHLALHDIRIIAYEIRDQNREWVDGQGDSFVVKYYAHYY